MNIKEYLRNRITLTIICIIILVNILLMVFMDWKTLSILSGVFGLISFVLTVVMVGLILRYNPRTDRKNRLVRCKERINSFVERHKSLKWLQGDRAMEFLLLYIGITLGFCSLLLRLWVDIIS